MRKFLLVSVLVVSVVALVGCGQKAVEEPSTEVTPNEVVTVDVVAS